MFRLEGGVRGGVFGFYLKTYILCETTVILDKHVIAVTGDGSSASLKSVMLSSWFTSLPDVCSVHVVCLLSL